MIYKIEEFISNSVPSEYFIEEILKYAQEHQVCIRLIFIDNLQTEKHIYVYPYNSIETIKTRVSFV